MMGREARSTAGAWLAPDPDSLTGIISQIKLLCKMVYG